MEKVKNILFRMKLKGNGIVNFDGTEQRFLLNGTDLHHMKTAHNNMSPAKKRLYRDGDKTTYKICISSNCLRYNLFKDVIPYQSPNLINLEPILYAFIASPSALLRGYQFSGIVNRTGPLCITDAEQTNNAVSHIETFSRSGPKNTDAEIVDNTFFKKEVVGYIEYACIGNIDLMNLQFVSCDAIFGRLAFNSDRFNMYKQFLKAKMPDFDSELGYYQIKNSDVKLPEHGFLLNNANMEHLVREQLERLLRFSIKKSGAYVETSKLEYKIVYDALEDTLDNEDGWVKLSNMSDINKISFDAEDFYVLKDSDTAKQERAAIEADYDLKKQKSIETEAVRKEDARAERAAKKKKPNDSDNGDIKAESDI